MKIVIGLGNPGRKYARTRHNAGFAAVEALADILGIDLTLEKYHCLVGKGRIGSHDVLFAKPQTYMNESGRSAGAILRYTSASVSDFIVAHDDLDLPLGAVRIKIGGGHGGHNGLRSLIDHLRSNDFIRVRIGIGRPEPGRDPADYVLSPFAAGERKTADEAISHAVDAVRLAIVEGPERAMNRFNKR